jgi:hypothetical protein
MAKQGKLPRFRLRYGLRSLMGLVTLVAIVLSAWLWRMHARIEAARRLSPEGVAFLVVPAKPAWVPSDEKAEKPFVRPAMAEVFVYVSTNGQIEISDVLLELAAAKRRLAQLRQEIGHAGVSIVHVQLVAHDASVNSLLSSQRGMETAIAIMEYANDNGFASVGFLESSQVDERRRNLDSAGVTWP